MINQKHKKVFGDLPVKVLQIGEGNFLRAFADVIIEQMNLKGIFGGSVVMCQPNGNDFADVLNGQDCVYTVLTRGKENGRIVENPTIITSVRECINPKRNYKNLLSYACGENLQVIISNTTEAGIYYNPDDKITDEPPQSYPAKLTALLYERYKHFSGDKKKGVLILPVELIDKNGDRLKEIVLRHACEWSLPENFKEWLTDSCCFANTLVDRIVTGYPRDEADELCEKFGYNDNCIDTCEPFLFWAIEFPDEWKNVFPADKSGFNVIFSQDITPYKTRKVRILNGAHTVSVLAAFHCGYDIVLQMMNDEVLREYIKRAMFSEIIPTINLPENELAEFAESVLERFDNPFIRHRLLDISLNSVTKYKARCLDTLLDYYKINGSLPPILTFGLAALINFYDGEFENGKFFGIRGNEKYEIRDSEDVLKFMHKAHNESDAVKAILSNADFWGKDLNEIDGIEALVCEYLRDIKSVGVRAAIEKLIK